MSGLLVGGCSAPPSASPDPTAQPGFPIRAAFYYPWFPEGWTQRELSPYTRYRPAPGYYDSGARDVVAAHMRSLGYGGFQAVIVSWWGLGEKSEQLRLPVLLATAAEVAPDVHVTLYYEPEGVGDPPVEELVRDLRYITENYGAAANYLRVEGRPVIFVYNADDLDCEVADRWAAASAATGFYIVLKVFPRWSECVGQADGWHEYAPAVSYGSHIPDVATVTGSVTVSPGFWLAQDADPPSGALPHLERDLVRWRRDVAMMSSSGAQWHLVTSFNEWGEGTAVESAQEWTSPSGYGAYLDVLHRNGQ